MFSDYQNKLKLIFMYSRAFLERVGPISKLQLLLVALCKFRDALCSCRVTILEIYSVPDMPSQFTGTLLFHDLSAIVSLQLFRSDVAPHCSRGVCQ
jgi:hypothetical protein